MNSLDQRCIATAPQTPEARDWGDHALGSTGTGAVLTSPSHRNSALDFCKGMLVLLMILYHWINYFVSREGDFYRYLRFITPSFIFITGFLISNVYLARYTLGDPQLYRRLLLRGFKLLAVFVGLNLFGSVLLGAGSGVEYLFKNAGSIFITGNGTTASFAILVPISYVLLFSGAMLALPSVSTGLVYWVLGGLLICVHLLGRHGMTSANLELFAVGILGMTVGRIPLNRLDELARHTGVVVVAYGANVLALTVWGEIYVLQVVGVAVNLALLYIVGRRAWTQGWAQRCILRLGQYTLFAYIAQIALILALSLGLHHAELAPGPTRVLSFLGAFGLTVSAVMALHFLRGQALWVDRAYRWIFA